MSVVLKTPEQVTAYTLANFDEMTEEQIGQFERNVAKACPYSSERGLLYALRVSKCVPALKSFKAIAARWETAYNGTKGTGGFIGGMGSPNEQGTYDFLVALYSRRLNELSEEIVAKAEQGVATRKAPSAKSKAIYAALDKIEKGYEDAILFPGALDHKKTWLACLEGKLWPVVDLYCESTENRCGRIVEKAEKRIAAEQTDSEKCEAFQNVVDEIEKAYGELERNTGSMKTEKMRAWIERLEKKLRAVAQLKIKATCDGCGNPRRVLAKIESGQWVCRTCVREIRAS